MRVIGLLGGLSWESSAQYYRIVNEAVRRRLGGLHSARCVLWSVDFAEVERLQHEDRWDEATAILVDAARRLERAGAELLLVCSNTMHRMADEVQAAVAIPLLHIADPVGERAAAAGHRRVGLLGTAFTMEAAFYRERLARRFGLDVVVPDAAERRAVHEVIFRELVVGRVEPRSRERLRAIVAGLAGRGAEAVVLGCTELTLLLRPEDAAVPLLDTTALHAEAAVERALGG